MLQANAANTLAYVGDQIGGSFWKQVMIVAVLGGTLASLQAAIVSSSRISFAMGRDRVFPGWFGAVSQKYRTPWNATIAFGLLNVVFLWGSTLIGSIGQALDDIVSTLGLMAAIFYMSARNGGVVLPPLDHAERQRPDPGRRPARSGRGLHGLRDHLLAGHRFADGVEIAFGFGFALLGLILSVISQRAGQSGFYSGAGQDPARVGLRPPPK